MTSARSSTQKQVAQKRKQQKSLKPLVNEVQEAVNKPSEMYQMTETAEHVSQRVDSPLQSAREDTEKVILSEGLSSLSNVKAGQDILVQVQTPTTSEALDESNQATLFQSPNVRHEPLTERKEGGSMLNVPTIELNQVC